MVGTTGRPGHKLCTVFSSASTTSGNNGDGGTPTCGTIAPFAAFTGTIMTLTLGSAATLSSVLRTSSGSSPGIMRQLTLARAVCGSALGACPPVSIVATHVVCSSELKYGTCDNRRTAAGSGGSLATARICSAVSALER